MIFNWIIFFLVIGVASVLLLIWAGIFEKGGKE